MRPNMIALLSTLVIIVAIILGALALVTLLGPVQLRPLP
jgi:hypothetical protein